MEWNTGWNGVRGHKVKRGDLGHRVTWDGGVLFQSCFEITKSFKILFCTHKHLCFVSLSEASLECFGYSVGKKQP